MFSGMLNSIPVVGHAKGFIQMHVFHDVEGGRKAMYESTRSTAAIVGGALGAVGGPGGMAMGAIAAASLVDTVVTVATDKPSGYIAGIEEIVNDIEDGKVPVSSVLKTGVMVGADALSGMGGKVVTNVAETAITSSGKHIGREMVKSAVKSSGKGLFVAAACAQGGMASEIREDYRRFGSGSRYRSSPSTSSGSGSTGWSESKPPPSTSSGSGSTGWSESKPPPSTSSGSESKPSSSAGCGSGSGPPKDNKENDKKPHETEEPKPDPEQDHWTIFLEIFQAKSLDDICIRGRKIFKGLVRGRKNTLKRLIKRLMQQNCLNEVIESVVNILNDTSVAEEDVVFENFLSLVNFADVYIGERLAEILEIKMLYGEIGPIDALRQCTFDTDKGTLAKDILNTFHDVWRKISKFRFDPYFRNIFSAIYHYYKHRLVPGMGIELTISKYIDLIVSLLNKLKTLEVYGELGRGRDEITFDRYMTVYGSRVRIVVKFQGGKVVLSSCYFLDDCYGDDQDGDEFIDSEKIN